MDEYSSGGGGKLKLKGAKVADGRVKKKKSSKKASSSAAATAGESTEDITQNEKDQESAARDGSLPAVGGGDEEEGSGAGSRSGSVTPAPAKTEAERRHEEMRRKRVQERLKKEGVKTHKEKVEELNKYLSRLSEHHDMPKIGPG
ncbi:uncharacterized protein BDV17DRAFT_248430 [Aspergillus undulatus]|uniref:uncharacterized protein n=1 Tax=Aspergillus undulatus TaxID=1810928 RepID=UPI003CCCC404